MSSSQLYSLIFFKIPKSSARFRCVTSFALASPVSHLGYCGISEWHVRSACAHVSTCVNVALSRKVLSLTKPKGIKQNPSAIILQVDQLSQPVVSSFIIILCVCCICLLCVKSLLFFLHIIYTCYSLASYQFPLILFSPIMIMIMVSLYLLPLPILCTSYLIANTSIIIRPIILYRGIILYWVSKLLKLLT